MPPVDAETQKRKRRDFLKAYKASGSVVEAAKRVGIDRRTPHNWRKRDERFAKRFDKISRAGGDHMPRKHLHELDAQHHQAMAYRLQGLTYEEIAVKVDRTVDTIRNWFHRDHTFRAAFEELKAEVIERAKERLVMNSEKAALKLVELLKSQTPFEAMGAAKDILDRAGLKPPDKRDLNVTGSLTLEQALAEIGDDEGA